jgi:hypothetical protein
MRDLNLGPDSRDLIKKYRDPVYHQGNRSVVADNMAAMLERWMEVGWCWPDSSPARICGGPHVKVKYEFNQSVEVIEPANKVGETFPDAKYTIITEPNYTDMIHRETGGSDPLVQEPKGKP